MTDDPRKAGVTFAEASEAMRRVGAAARRIVRTSHFQALIRADYEARLAELPWWRFKARRDLTRRYRMLTDAEAK